MEHGSLLPRAVGLCPNPDHTMKYFTALEDEGAYYCTEPGCELRLAIYVPKRRRRRRLLSEIPEEPLTGVQRSWP